MDEKKLIFAKHLHAKEDVGRIIGRNGYVISSLRSLLDASGEKHGTRVRLKIHSLDQGGRSRPVEE